MKRILLTAIVATFATNAAAVNCYQALTSNHSKDSQAFQLSEDEVENWDDIGIEYASAAVHALAKKLKCDEQPKLDHRASECGEIVPGIAESEACYLKTDIGYFITTVDYLMNINIVFHRYD